MSVRIAVALFAALLLDVACSSPGPREHGHVAFDVSPDGKSVVFSPADGVEGLYVLDLGTRTVRQLSAARGITTAPAYAPDGREVAFALAAAHDSPFHLFVYSFATRRLSQITDDSSVSDLSPSFSSDGSTIVFARAYLQRPYSMGGLRWDHWDVATIGRDGTHFRRLTNRRYYELVSPQFADKDSEVVYSATSGVGSMGSALFRLAPQSSRAPRPYSISIPHRACSNGASEPRTSRDGRRLAFIADGQECYRYDVYLVDNGAPDVRALGVTWASVYNRSPVFVPGTRQIMYLAGTEEAGGNRSRFSLYSVGRDGSDPHPVAGPALFDDPLHWRGK